MNKVAALAFIGGILFAGSFALVHVAAQAPVIGQGGGAPAPPTVNRGSHDHIAGPQPTAQANCMGAQIWGSDVAGYVSIPTGVTDCNLLFASPYLTNPNQTGTWAQTPICAVNVIDNTTSRASITYGANEMGLGFHNLSGGETIVYRCIGPQLP